MRLGRTSLAWALIFLALGNFAAAQSQDRDHPTSLTSYNSSVSGSIPAGETKGKDRIANYYFSFRAAPGEFKLTLEAVSNRDVSGIFVNLYLYDVNDNTVGSAFTFASVGDERKTVVLNSPKGGTLLLRIETHDPAGLGREKRDRGGKWRVIFSGAAPR